MTNPAAGPHTRQQLDTARWARELAGYRAQSPGGLPPGAFVPAYALLADVVAAACPRSVHTLGLCGPQGAGKSTLVNYLVRAFVSRGRPAAALALDDYYHSHAVRGHLAACVHPLLQTRGVPGTHEVGRLADDLQALASGDTRLTPVFDKGTDDRLPAADWRRVGPAADPVIIVEGWCVGVPPAGPDEDLMAPLNTLEAREDADGSWRRYVDAALAGSYAELHAQLDTLILLATPDFDASRRWRARQDLELPPHQRMSAQQLERFMAHYQRLAERALRRLRGSADVVVELGADHDVVAVSIGGALDPHTFTYQP